jgi:flagellar motor switch protein FliG
MSDWADTSAEDLSAVQKVAVLLIALGEDTAAEIVGHLDEDEVEQIAQAISEMQAVPPGLMDQVLAEFEQLLRSGHGVDTGGTDVARSILEQAIGGERAGEMMAAIADKKNRSFYRLRHSDPQELTHVLQKEQPQTIAVVLAQLDPEQAAIVFDGLSADKQPDVAYRMAKLQEISPQALQELENSLAAELKEIVDSPTSHVGGAGAVADMLAHVGRATESSILGKIDVLDPKVAEGIRNRLVTFDSLTQLPQPQIQSILKDIDKQDLALAMKSAPDRTAEVIFGAMSKRAQAQLKEEIAFMGQVRQSEVDNAQLRIAQIIRQRESTGEVTFVRNGDSDTYIQ